MHNRLSNPCVTKRIREEFSSPDGTYTGFKEGQEVDETDFTLVHNIEMPNDEE